MKIAFFTEGQWTGTVDRKNTNMRTEFAWMCALNAVHLPLQSGEYVNCVPKYFDVGIIINPKKTPITTVDNIRKICKKIGIMQEGPHTYFQDYFPTTQLFITKLLSDVDFIFCHNEYDKVYYLTFNDKVFVNRSLMITDPYDDLKLEVCGVKKSVIIGGNFCSWYGGVDSYIVATKFGLPIYAPSMGRMDISEKALKIRHLPYLDHKTWIDKLSGFNCGIHLMRTIAAGTFALNCAYVGIPCIGYCQVDTQRLLFPSCSVDVGDLRFAIRIVNELKDGQSFCCHAIDEAKYFFNQDFSEEVWLSRVYSFFENDLHLK